LLLLVSIVVGLVPIAELVSRKPEPQQTEAKLQSSTLNHASTNFKASTPGKFSHKGAQAELLSISFQSFFTNGPCGQERSQVVCKGEIIPEGQTLLFSCTKLYNKNLRQFSSNRKVAIMGAANTVTNPKARNEFA